MPKHENNKWPWKKEQSVNRKEKLKRRKQLKRRFPKINKLFADLKAERGG
jgi:hypothetical protein